MNKTVQIYCDQTNINIKQLAEELCKTEFEVINIIEGTFVCQIIQVKLNFYELIEPFKNILVKWITRWVQ